MRKNQWLLAALGITILCIGAVCAMGATAILFFGARYDRWTCAQVIQRIRESGLEAEDARPLTPEGYGLAPMTASQAVWFMIPSLGPDRGGRVFAFASQDDLDRTRRYYEELGRSSAVFSSWVFARDNVLIQIGGDLPETNARQYDRALQSLGGAIPRMTRSPLPSKTPTATRYPTPTRAAMFTTLPTLTLAPTPTRPSAQQFVPAAKSPTSAIRVCIRTGAVCRDGTTSTSTGSGACSRHGGVARWLCQ